MTSAVKVSSLRSGWRWRGFFCVSIQTMRMIPRKRTAMPTVLWSENASKIFWIWSWAVSRRLAA